MAFVAFSSLEDGALFIHNNQLWRKEVLLQIPLNAYLVEFYKESGRRRFDDPFLVQPCTQEEWDQLRKNRQETFQTKTTPLRGRAFHG